MLDLDRTPQYLINDTAILSQAGLTRRWMAADILPDPVILPDRPWESRTLAFPSVVRLDNDELRMYYTGVWHMQKPLGWPRVMVAASDDGFRWHKPDLGLYEWRGSTANNISWTRQGHMELGTAILDRSDPGHEVFRLLSYESDNRDVPWPWPPDRGLYAYTSEDGYRWTGIGQAPCVAAGDRTSLMSTKVDGKFVAFTRHKDMLHDTGWRSIYRIESEDFVHWSEPELVLSADLIDAPGAELYGMCAFERHGIYWGLLEVWDHSEDVMRVQLAYSYNSKNWHRPTQRSTFIGPRYEWNRRWNNCASNGPIEINEQLVFYFNGRAVGHDFDSARQHGVIGAAALRRDRFCAIEGHTGGHFVTDTMRWPGGDLAINADTRSVIDAHPRKLDGMITVDVLNGDSDEMPEYSGANAALYSGNTIARGEGADGIVRWPGGRSLNALAGQHIRLRFGLRRARIYTYGADRSASS